MTLLQGILTGKYASLADVPEWQRRTRHFNSAGTPKCRHGEAGFEKETTEALKEIESISKSCGIKMSVLATQWALKMGIDCALVGARNVKQLEENLQALEVEVDDEIIVRLNKATETLKGKLGNHFDYYESKENDRTL
jgi:aryl-alcohol dehydrogenase-like predicted oxidoreductase